VEVSADALGIGNRDAESNDPSLGDMSVNNNQHHQFYCGVDLLARTIPALRACGPQATVPVRLRKPNAKLR
jgi:hypothetical protein